MAISRAEFPTADTLNINISAYRVLFILLVLTRYRSLNMDELNGFLLENRLIERAYNSETLTKYINTLREVGCDIPRASSRNDYCYELRKAPFPLHLEADEKRAAQKMLTLLAQQADETAYLGYRDLLEALAWAAELSGTSPGTTGETQPALAGQPFPKLLQRRDQMKTYRRYCRDAFTLAIEYHPPGGGNLQKIWLEPREVLEQGPRLILVGTEQRSHEPLALDVDTIESIRQTPSKSRHQPPETTVVFALYGRLAHSYRPYPEEKVVYRNPDQLRVKTRVIEPSALLSRLLKYGNSCEVLTPEPLRQTMRTRITALLTTLQESPELSGTFINDKAGG